MLGLPTTAIQPAVRPPSPIPEVHRHALLREGRVAPGRRGQARDQRRLARPEARAARSLDRDQDERLPRLADERQESIADRLEDEPARERRARADAVDQRPRENSRSELRERGDSDDQPGRPEREPADVVQVDDEERQREPVPERVHEPADLEQPDRQREPRVQAAQVPGRHRDSFTQGPCPTDTRPPDPSRIRLNRAVRLLGRDQRGRFAVVAASSSESATITAAVRRPPREVSDGTDRVHSRQH